MITDSQKCFDLYFPTDLCFLVLFLLLPRWWYVFGGIFHQCTQTVPWYPKKQNWLQDDRSNTFGHFPLLFRAFTFTVLTKFYQWRNKGTSLINVLLTKGRWFQLPLSDVYSMCWNKLMMQCDALLANAKQELSLIKHKINAFLDNWSLMRL